VDIKALGDRLLEAGAPVLKSIVQKSIGGVGGMLAGAAIDALAAALKTAPTPEAVAEAIEADPVAAAPAVREVEQQFTDELARIAEANRDVMLGYQQVLLADARTEGWLAQRWRPIFAIAFTFCFVLIAVTVCRGIWIGQLQGVEAVTGLLITMLAAGCAVLGVQIWQRSEEKKAGVV
jgi:hypothetical protein